MNEERQFTDALAENVYDELTHRAYADWLEERGRDDEARHHRLWTREWQDAYGRLREFCRRVDLNFSYFLEEAEAHLKDQGDIAVTLETSHATMAEDMVQVWRDAAAVLRVPEVPGKDSDPFGCGGNCFPDGLSWGDDYE